MFSEQVVFNLLFPFYRPSHASVITKVWYLPHLSVLVKKFNVPETVTMYAEQESMGAFHIMWFMKKVNFIVTTR